MNSKANGHTPRRAVLYARVSTKGQAEHGYSLRQQIEALRDHAHNEGYEVLTEIVDDGYTAATMERPGLERVRDLVAAGGVDVVFAQDADRITREPIHRAMLDSEFEQHGCRLIALDDWGDDSYEGELLKYVRGWKSKGERLEIAKRTRRGRWQRAREGKILPTRYPPYGFRYDKEAATYKVDPVTMTHARRIFQMVGEQGTSLTAVKNAFEDEGIPKPGDGKYWDISMIRHMLEHDVYLTRPYEEVRELVPPGVKLEPGHGYSIYWYNRKRTKRRHRGIKVTENDPTE
jgi:site-specific DNA recombinase